MFSGVLAQLIKILWIASSSCLSQNSLDSWAAAASWFSDRWPPICFRQPHRGSICSGSSRSDVRRKEGSSENSLFIFVFSVINNRRSNDWNDFMNLSRYSHNRYSDDWESSQTSINHHFKCFYIILTCPVKLIKAVSTQLTCPRSFQPQVVVFFKETYFKLEPSLQFSLEINKKIFI